VRREAEASGVPRHVLQLIAILERDVAVNFRPVYECPGLALQIANNIGVFVRNDFTMVCADGPARTTHLTIGRTANHKPFVGNDDFRTCGFTILVLELPM
jgi:hypothetical protein